MYYKSYSVSLTEGQKANLARTYKDRSPITIRLNNDQISLLELIIGSTDAGNDNSKMKNRGMTILDELLKLGAISKGQHEKLYIGY